MSERKSFLRVGIIYVIGQVIYKAISFVFLPIYTRKLGTIGYGQLSLADMILDILNGFVICGIYTGYNRYYREYDEKYRRKLKNTAINFALISASLCIMLTILFGKSIVNIAFKFDGSYRIFILAVIRSITTQFITLLMCDYALNYRAGISILMNLTNLILNLIFSINFVVFKNQGIIGVYKGYVLSNIIILIYLVLVSIRQYRFEFDRKMLKEMFKFSVGFIPGSFSSTILTLSDRYFLAGYKSYTETGVYSIGYKFGMLIDPFFIGPFKSIFTPYKFEIWKDEDAQEKFKVIFEKYHFIGLFIMLGISFISKSAIMIFTTKDFIDAYKIVPLILFSYFLYGKVCFYNLGLEIRNKTYLDSFIMFAGAALNVVLNIIMIPKLGMYGATLATCISYLIMNLIYIISTLPMYFVRYNFKKVFLFYLVGFSLYLVYYFGSLTTMPLLYEVIFVITLLIMYVLLCIFLKLVKVEDLQKYKYSILKKKVISK